MLNGRTVVLEDDSGTLLEALRGELAISSVKDGCSPQGQCGCCTVLVNGAPRVACVTPLRRVRGREITTLEGLDGAAQWGEALCASGGSQCGFCTPGIIVRLDGLSRKGGDLSDRSQVDKALAAHLCRCTGWQTIREAAVTVGETARPDRDLELASQRALIEGGVPQVVSPEVALGAGGFSEDEAPADALVAVLDDSGAWVVAESLPEAMALSNKVQGRRTTQGLLYPLEFAEGDWAHRLRTTWVEPGYLEPDASWCEPGGTPYSPLVNGGAFGAKTASLVTDVAARLAKEHGKVVRVVLAREDVVRLGPKRPPVAIALNADGRGVLRVVETNGVEALVAEFAPGFGLELAVEQVQVPGPTTSLDIRAAIWAELALANASLKGQAPITSPSGATAEVNIDDSGVTVSLSCGRILDEAVLRSYCIGAVHMALGWIRSEALTVDESGNVLDLTIRSFGIVRPSEMPDVHVELTEQTGEPVNGSDAVFVAAAAAEYLRLGSPGAIPVNG